MVSSITGMVAKAPSPSTDKLVNPGISYWVVLESPDVDPRAIVRNLQGALTGQAEVKLLQEPPILNSLDKMHITLCNTIKDHSNSYIKRRLGESSQDASDPAIPGVGLATRIVTLPNHLAEFCRQAQAGLVNGSIAVDLLEYPQIT